MTYVDNMNAVNRILKVERVSASVVTVLWILLAENNEHREEGWFEMTDEEIRSRVSQLSKAQVTAAKRRLKELGVINYEAESNAPRRGTRYVVTLSKAGAKIGAKIGAKSGAKLGVKEKKSINACAKRGESKEKEKESNKEKEVVDFEAYASSTASLEAEYAGLVKASVDSEPEAKAEVKPEELPVETSLEAKAEVKPEELPVEASLEAKAEVKPEEPPVEASLESSVEVMTAKETPSASAQVLTISDCVAGGAASENRLKGKPPLEPDWLSYVNGGKEYDDRLNGVIGETPGRACG